jgi:hypothetical protein
MLRALYCYVNVGIEALEIENRVLYPYDNVGIQALEVENRVLYPYDNVGIQALEVENRALYPYDNVTDDPPFPYLEKIAPNQGPEGLAVVLTGDGFGSTPEDYDGIVLLNDEEMGITAWAWKTITANVPSLAESGQIKVRELTPDPPGSRDSAGKYFMVTENVLSDAARLEVKLYSGATLLHILDGAK